MRASGVEISPENPNFFRVSEISITKECIGSVLNKEWWKILLELG